MAVVGATGAVGEVLLDVLAQRSFPIRELRPLASERSVGSTVRFAGRDVEVSEARPEAFDGVDFVFFAATGTLSKDLAPEAVRRGAVVIDKSSTWRMEENVPLVVPEINPDALFRHQGIVAFAAAKSYATQEAVLLRAAAKHQAPLVVILDGVEDPHNLGAVLRTAEAAGVHGVFIPERRAVGLTSVVAKVSAGALDYIPVARVTNLQNGRSIVVRINDRGPFVDDRIIDLSRAGARELGFERDGLARVRVAVLREASLRLKQAAGAEIHEAIADIGAAVAR